jgi:hypothetical protein
LNLGFVVGTGRCGSSLIHELLACHEGVGFVSNLDDNLPWLSLKGRLNNVAYAATKGAWTRKGRVRFAPSEAFRLIGRDVSPIYVNSCRDLLATDVTPWLRHRFHGFFEARIQAQGRPTFLHKYTGWPRIGFFAEIFPAAKFVHVVRDGRAVANSWLQMDWWGGYRGPAHWPWGPLPDDLRARWEDSGRSFAVLAGLSWRLLMEAYIEAAAAVGPERMLEVRYEDFLSDPRQTMARIAGFFALPQSVRLDAAIARVRIDSGRERPFERELTRAQLVEISEPMSGLLQRYGYD